MTDPKTTLLQLTNNYNILQEREAKYGGNAPLELLNQIDDHKQAIALTEQAITGEISGAQWQESLKPLLLAFQNGQIINIEADKYIVGDMHESILTGANVQGFVQANYGNVTIIYNFPEVLSSVIQSKTSSGDTTIPPCPYRGLFTFRPEDARFFCGREVATQNLARAAQSRSLVAVLGASGSGKSSLVFAGLVPTLNQAGQWIFTTFRPGDDPFLGLASALVPLYETELSKTKQMMVNHELSISLREGKLPLSDVLYMIHQTQPNHRLLIIVDQFEELYTLCPESNIRQQFLDMLLSILDEASSSTTRIVLTLRADFLGPASLYRPFADMLQGKTELLGPMTRAELTRAIEMPAKQLGVTFEDGLTTRILEDVGEEPGNLPLLEFALTELWELQRQGLLTHRAYNEIGEVSGALSRYADGVFNGLGESDKLPARRIFIQLVKPGQGTEDTRRLATRIELGQDNWSLVAYLATRRLITTNATQGAQETAELIHEALIKNWHLIKAWLDEDREFRIWQERLRNDLAEWLDSNRADTALMRSFSLAEARYWLTNRPHDISLPERELIETSLLKYQRQEQQRYLTSIGSIIAVVVITVLVIFNLALLSRP